MHFRQENPLPVPDITLQADIQLSILPAPVPKIASFFPSTNDGDESTSKATLIAFTSSKLRTYPEYGERLFHKASQGLGGWSDGAMVLGKLPVPGRPTIWITVGQGPTALAVGAGGGCLDIFTLTYPFSPGGGRVVRWSWVNFQCRGVLHFG